jgi:hypothetical protein
MPPLHQGAQRLSDRIHVARREALQTGERQLHVIKRQRPARAEQQAEPAASQTAQKRCPSPGSGVDGEALVAGAGG